jgi:hypothetical protein
MAALESRRRCFGGDPRWSRLRAPKTGPDPTRTRQG